MSKKQAMYLSDDEIPEYLDMAAGKRHMREVYGRSQVAEKRQVDFWMNYLESIALSRIEWENLPAGIDPRALEYELYLFGVVGLFQADEYMGREGGYLVAQCSNLGNINMYYNPNRVLLIAPNGGSDGNTAQWWRWAQAWVDEAGQVQPPNCALCWNSLLRRPLRPMLRNYARRLAEIDRIVQVNMGAQRTPYIIAGAEGSTRTTKRIIQKLEDNEQFIVYNQPGIDPTQAVQVLQTQSPYVGKDLLDDQKTILNQALSLMGVDNDPQAQKKERKNSLEVLQNNEQVMMCRQNFLKARELFADDCERIFGIRPVPKWAAQHEEEAQGAEGGREGDEDMGGYEVDYQ